MTKRLWKDWYWVLVALAIVALGQLLPRPPSPRCETAITAAISYAVANAPDWAGQLPEEYQVQAIEAWASQAAESCR